MTKRLSARQKKAINNIKYAANDLIGGLENTLLDYPEDREEYKRADTLLKDHSRLVEILYRMATTAVYDEGYCGFGNGHLRLICDINFCGKEWLMEQCDERITEEGY